MSDGLKSKTLHGIFWSFLERIGQQGVQFVISIILARLLMPAEFGLIAMLAIFMAVSQSLIDSGFGSALIQKQDATRVDESSIFYFNLVVGFIASGLIFLSAPWIAAFYETPQLLPITRVMSLNLFIGAFGMVQSTLMTKRVDFKKQMKVSMVASVASGAIGISLAYSGYGVWSLVVQMICANIFRTIMLWLVFSWRPILAFSVASLRSMFSYGSKILIAGMVHTISDNIYTLVIGKVFSAADLGFYARARGMEQLVSQNTSSTVSRVTFPVFASVQEDKERLKRGVRRALTSMAMMNFPLMIGLAIIAKPLILVLLTDKWLPSVPYLQLLCVVGLLYPLHLININVLMAQGRSDLNLRLGLLKNALRLVFLFVTYRWGIEAIIWGQIVLTFLAYYINCYYTAKLINYTIWEQVQDLLPYVGIPVVMGAGVFALKYAILESVVLLLTIQILAGIVLFLGLSAIFRPQAFTEARDTLVRQLDLKFRKPKDG